MPTTSASGALARVGVPDPGGDPAAQRRTAQAWHDLAGGLQENSATLNALSARAGQVWQGGGAGGFQARAQALADRAAMGAKAAGQTAKARTGQADRHEQVLELLRQIGIEIASMLAFWAAAAAFPPLLAAADAWLTALAVQGGRIVQFLARALAELVGFLVRSRAWIQEVMALTWRTERFSLGYGRMLTEGIRDVVIDLSSNSVTSAILGKKIDPAQLFKNAGIAALTGGLLGGIEKSGISRVVDDLGAVKRASDGLPVFRSFSDQAKTAVNSLGKRSASSARKVATDGPFAELSEKAKTAQDLGLRGTPAEHEALTQDLDTLKTAEQQTLARQTDARRLATHTADRAGAQQEILNAHQAAEETAAADLQVARTAHEVVTASRSPDMIARSADDLRTAAELHTTALRDLKSSTRLTAETDRAATEAQRSALAADAETNAIQARVTAADDRLTASTGWQDARDAVRQNTSVREQWSDAWERNVWRDGFGSRKALTETMLYDTPRYFVKGATSNALKGATDPGATAGSVARRALIGGTTSAIRGALNSFADNLVYPKSGIEETLWKIGIKGVDNLVSAKTQPPPPAHQP